MSILILGSLRNMHLSIRLADREDLTPITERFYRYIARLRIVGERSYDASETRKRRGRREIRRAWKTATHSLRDLCVSAFRLLDACCDVV